ncbi:MAG: PHP domain-containing protein [Dehalococcoidia bacterium]|nr:PHP domain-containing protein [Dehalococcoidia bacterium]
MATVPQLLDYVERRTQLDVIAVTEHDTLRAGAEARELCARGRPDGAPYRFDVICGEEVTTLDGHLLALAVDEPVPSFRRIEETLSAIHRQGGIAIVPHPLSFLTRSVTRRGFDRVLASADDAVRFDALEEYNLSPAGRVRSARARALNRERLHLAAIGASDAHFLPSVGSAFTTFPGRSAGDLFAAIAAKTSAGAAGRAPRLSELGYRNIVVQQCRGMLATPRAMGWLPTVRSFVRSRLRREGPPAPSDERPAGR